MYGLEGHEQLYAGGSDEDRPAVWLYLCLFGECRLVEGVERTCVYAVCHVGVFVSLQY